MTDTFFTDSIRYLRHVERWTDPVLAAIGGYAAAMCAWGMTHRAALTGFVLKNDLALDARRGLALLLLAGVFVALGLWLGIGWGMTRIRSRPVAQALPLAARLLFLAPPLPLLPLLTIPGLESDTPFLAFGIVAAAAGAMFAAARTLGVGGWGSGVRGQSSVVSDQSEDSGRRSAVGGRQSYRAGLIATLVLAAAYALFMSVLTVARHNSFMTHAFDLGIHDQAIYNILHGGAMRTTLYGPYAIDYLGDHFSPFLYLVAPIYALFQDARTLLVLQSLFLAAGAIPLHLLTRHLTRSALLGVTLAAGYLLYPALHGVNLKDFHQIALVCLPLLAALYFLERDRMVPFLIALGLALMVKEEVALTVAAIGVYVFLGKRRYRLGGAIVLVSLAYFAVVIGWAMPHLGGTPQIDTRFGGYIAPGTEGAAGVAWTLITNPFFTAIWILGTPGKLIFLLQIFLPVLFLPILAPAAAWIPALPSLAILLLTSAHTQYDITYQYSAHLIPFVFFLTAQGMARLRSRAPHPYPRPAGARGSVPSSSQGEGQGEGSFRFALAAGLLVASLAMTYQFGQIVNKQGVSIPTPTAHDAVVASFVAQIPRDALVSAMSDIVTHLTARRTAYLFPDVADAEYLLLDTDLHANFWPHEGLKAHDLSVRDMIPHVHSGQFGLSRLEDGVLLLKRGADTSRNNEALAALLTALYEAEEQKSDLEGTAVADPQASDGRARVATPAAVRPDGRVALMFGPYTDLPQGKYRVEFRLRFDRTDLTERVATVDVFTFRDGYPRASRDIRGTDFSTPNQYQTFTLEFESDKPLQDLEFRVQYAGQGTLGLDYVRVSPIEVWLP